MPAPERVAANACSHSSSGTASESSGSKSTSRCSISSSARPHDAGVDALPDVIVSSLKHAFALAESRLGAGRGANDMMCIVCGTGIGGGLVLRGRLHLGPEQRAGEFGHHTVSEKGPVCECGNHGCLELYAGARAIARAAGAETFDETLERARAGDRQATDALDRAGTLIGLAIANVLIFLCPERVVVGGGVVQAGELLLEPLRRSIAAHARVAPLDQIAIATAELGPHAGAIGAALWGAEA
jgi:predicted NBD/HSP70 family sugar kinase